jgi:hypothetical protein
MTTKFSDLGIKTEISHFVGDKLKISKILNKEIEVLGFLIKPSNFKGEMLQLQIKVNGNLHVVFTGSTVLINMINKVPLNKFPFIATIIEESEHYEFT